MSYALQNWLLQVTVLHVAAKHSTASAVTALIDAGAEVEAQSSFKSRPLHWAAAFNSASVIAVLIASKSDVNAQGFLQQTPLHRAAEMNEEAVPLLLEAKANVNILDKKQRSPLFFAAKRKHEQSVILLCKAGADPNLGVSPLNHYSIDDSMKALIKKHRERWELLNWTIFLLMTAWKLWPKSTEKKKNKTCVPCCKDRAWAKCDPLVQSKGRPQP